MPTKNELQTTKEKWKINVDVKNWLNSRLNGPQSSYDNRINQVKIWLKTDEHRIWMNNLNSVALPKAPEKAIQYIINSQPTETWKWRLNEVISKEVDEICKAGCELYVVWWCYMRKFVDDHPYLLRLALGELPPNWQQNKIFEQNEVSKLKEHRYIYPTLNKWSLFFETDGLSVTEDLSVTEVQDMILAKFAGMLLKLAADRQMFGSEKPYRPGIPRIILANGKKELKLDLNKEVGEIQGEILSRDASVVYIMQEGRKILSERGFDTGVWEKINKKYTWLLSGK